MSLGLRSTAQEILELNIDPSSGVFQRPRSVQHAFFTDALWIVMKAKKLESMPSLNRGQALKSLTEDIDITFKFLASNEIQEAIGHEWNEYDSLATRLAQKIAGFQRQKAELSQAYRASSNAVKGIWNALEKGDRPAEDLVRVARNYVSNLYGMKVAPVKVDAALVYTNSPRRQYTFDFTLIDEGNPRIDIVDPINRLIRLSSPDYELGDRTKFDLPYVFSVHTEPNKLININYAALVAVQPTYKGPFRSGYPSVCELQLQFIDLDPTYRRNFNKSMAERVSISSTLSKHIPYLDKFKKYSSIAERLGDQIDAYAEKTGSNINLVGRVRDSIQPMTGGESNWSKIVRNLLQVGK